MDFLGCTPMGFRNNGASISLNDEVELGRKRILIGIFMFILGLLCFTLIPFKLMTCGEPKFLKRGAKNNGCALSLHQEKLL